MPTINYASDVVYAAMRMAQQQALNQFTFRDILYILNQHWRYCYERMIQIESGYYTETRQLTSKLTKLPPYVFGSLVVYAAQDIDGFNRQIYTASGVKDTVAHYTYRVSGSDLYCWDAEYRNVFLEYVPAPKPLMFTMNNRDPEVIPYEDTGVFARKMMDDPEFVPNPVYPDLPVPQVEQPFWKQDQKYWRYGMYRLRLVDDKDWKPGTYDNEVRTGRKARHIDFLDPYQPEIPQVPAVPATPGDPNAVPPVPPTPEIPAVPFDPDHPELGGKAEIPHSQEPDFVDPVHRFTGDSELVFVPDQPAIPAVPADPGDPTATPPIPPTPAQPAVPAVPAHEELWPSDSDETDPALADEDVERFAGKRFILEHMGNPLKLRFDITEAIYRGAVDDESFKKEMYDVVAVLFDFPYCFVSYRHRASGDYHSVILKDLLSVIQRYKYNPFDYQGRSSHVKFIDAKYNDDTGMGVVVEDWDDLYTHYADDVDKTETIRPRVKRLGWTPDTIVTYPHDCIFDYLVCQLAMRFANKNESKILDIEYALRLAENEMNKWMKKERNPWMRVQNVVGPRISDLL